MEPGQSPLSHSAQQGSSSQLNPVRKRTAPERISTPPPPPPQPDVPPPPPPQQPAVPPQQEQGALVKQINVMGFFCPICNVFQPGRDGLEKHFSHKKGTVKKKCVWCRRTFDPKNELIFELRKYTYFCPACNRRFGSAKNLKDHLKVQRSYNYQDFHQCKTCKKVMYKDERIAHYEEEHGKIIPLSAVSLSRIPIKLNCVSTPNPTMSSAGATGGAASAGQTHPVWRPFDSPGTSQATTMQAKKCVCSMCNDGPDKLDELCAHVLAATPMEDRCMDCREKDYETFRRRVHYPLPDGEIAPKDEPKPCPACNAVFHNGIQLARHWDKHKAEEDHDCVGCNAKFTLSKFYKIHFNVHAKRDTRHGKLILPFKCRESSCESSESAQPYEDVLLYVQHMRREHRKAFPLQCPFPECENQPSFDEDGFSLHMTQTHFADAAHYRCTWCQQLFQNEEDWKEHKEDMGHEGRPYKCIICSDFFLRLGPLQSHMRNRHPLEQQ